jgi:hypothetical protein
MPAMKQHISRTQFLKRSIMTSMAVIPAGHLLGGLVEDPQLDRTLVKEFVGAAHRDKDKVTALLAEHPTLLNAAHDWKYGDYETALGAASHVGYKELAQFLIDQGAQANIFTAALFGRIEVLRPMLDFFPSALYALGPHGFTLLHHAERGGDEALEVKEYLLRLGAKETQVALY